ncbi:MAG TPA: SCO family protein [Xanthobacteraceae bacterium]|nr:SCO family protein [Xanthobacteraceae bacterium]
MNSKASRIVIMLGAFLGGLVLFLGAIFLVTGLSPSPTASASAIGGPFSLVDENGKVFSDQDMKGKPYLVFFGYTHCPDICPTTLFEMSQLFRKLGPDADKVGALFITVDPTRDTQAVMKEYMASFDPHLLGLTGSQNAIDQAIRDYRVYAKKVPLEGGDYSMDHTALVYLMDKDGHFVAPFNMQRKADAEAADLRHYL